MPAESTTAYQRVITAFFDDREDANEAIERLVSAGIPRSDITLVEGASREAASGETQREDEGSGFWATLKDFFMPDEDREVYAEGLRRGGYLVTARVSDADYQSAIDILDDEGTIDLSEREASWRAEGWTGYQGRPVSTDVGMGAGIATSSVTGETLRAGSDQEEVIPVAEEQIRIGKRDVSHGRVRIRSYVVETPVNEQVDLRSEHVHVERRPVDRPLTGDEQLFQDRTIEVEERAEEAVVAKEARVREEIVVNKDVEERTETISDTVRRTEVDVEDERGNTVPPTTPRR